MENKYLFSCTRVAQNLYLFRQSAFHFHSGSISQQAGAGSCVAFWNKLWRFRHLEGERETRKSQCQRERVRAFQVTINKAVCVRGSSKVVNKMDFPPRTTEKEKALGNEMTSYACRWSDNVRRLFDKNPWMEYLWRCIKSFLFCSRFVFPAQNRGEKMHIGSIKKRSNWM